MTRRQAAFAGAAAWLFLVALLTLTPQPAAQLPPRPWCFLCQDFGGIDFLLNVLLFVPLGFLLGMAGVCALRVAAVVLALTVLIEVSQYVALPGRVASTGDLVANFAGGVLGLVISRRWRPIILPEAREAMALSLAAAAGALTVLVMTAWLFGPAVPRAALWGQRSADLGQFDRFDGGLLEASIGEIPVPDRRFENQDAIHRTLEQDRIEVTATVVAGSITGRLAPIVSIFDSAHREVLILGQDGSSLAFRVRRRSAMFGLRAPTITVWDVFRDTPRTADARRTHIGGSLDGYRMAAWATSGGAELRRELEFRPTMGWAYILPFDNAWTPAARRFTSLWLLLILFPLGYWGRWAARARPVTVIAVVAATLASALVALPAVLGVSASARWEWIGAASGIACGAIISEVIILLTRSRRVPPGG